MRIIDDSTRFVASECIVVKPRWLFPRTAPIDYLVAGLYFTTVKPNEYGMLFPVVTIDRRQSVACFLVQAYGPIVVEWSRPAFLTLAYQPIAPDGNESFFPMRNPANRIQPSVSEINNDSQDGKRDQASPPILDTDVIGSAHSFLSPKSFPIHTIVWM
jgi:hypothetical protein